MDLPDAILERRAKGLAVKQIAAELGITGPGIRRIHRLIAEARAMHDPRAAYRNGRGLPASDERRAEIERQREIRKFRKRGREPGAPLDGWWFAAETIVVTRLGFGSRDCERVPVSVSCVPRQKALSRRSGGPTERLSVSRSLSEAMAKHPLSGHLQPTAEHSPT
jgi:hypothetical protein